ncbi:MAG TPA: tRNA pseudouridine(55) synthase TruB [Candidatus Limnocylindria bacterium]|nr:tRNA pseudouridine(55) synthase TruB [Candidatus Limnocylindria bacterium]
MLGVVNLDKPVGPTSHDMVGLLRRLTGTRRIGHAGTLDPLASGVLPILVGAATRFSEELTGGPKRYDAVIRLGQTSPTDDAEGPLVPGSGPLPDDEAIETGLAAFVGTFDQRPPAFSARKSAGQTAHRAARGGTLLEVPPRRVTIAALQLVDIRRGREVVDARIDVRCGPGTYIRSIARDLGERLGCGGHLAALRRTEAAGLSVQDARTPDVLRELAAEGRLEEAMVPIEELLTLPRLDLTAEQGVRFRHGSLVRVEGAHAGRHAVFDDRALLGVGSVAAGILRPHKVVAAAEA